MSVEKAYLLVICLTAAVPAARQAGYPGRRRCATATSIRAATASDASAVAEIYRQGIEDRQATFETRPRTGAELLAAVADRRGGPFVVAEQAGRVVGWGRISPFSTQTYYSGVGEASVYLERGDRGRGLGRRLLERLELEAKERGYWKIVGLLFATNAPSVALCRAAGYREVGVLRSHGRLDGRWRDVLLVERLLDEGARRAAGLG